MKRLHLFEWEDQAFFPSFLRNYGTDFIDFLAEKTQLYKDVLPIMAKALSKSGSSQIIDLGSGSGGGLLWLNHQLMDKFPQTKNHFDGFIPAY